MPNAIPVLKSILATKAAWRRHLSKTYPDKRNVAAAELLDTLASEVDSSVPDDLVAELDALSGTAIHRAAAETATRTGFRIFPRTLSEFVELVLVKADEQNAEIDTVFSKGGAR